MSDSLHSIVSTLQLNDYASVAIIVAISYDFTLTFSDERKHIWNRPWTWVSTLFVLVRYLGCMFAISAALLGSTLVPGPDIASSSSQLNHALHESLGNALHYLINWTYPIFLGSADLVMILRVYAMYGRSRIILGALLVVYVVEIAFIITAAAIYSRPNALVVTTAQVLELSFCSILYNTQTNWGKYATIPQFVLGALLCILAVLQFAWQSYLMYHATQQWQPNEYMSLLVREGILYFFVNLFYTTVGLVSEAGSSIQTSRIIILSALAYVSLCTTSPRFIINIRELYARNSLDNYGKGIDSGFGISLSGRSDITFAGVEPGEELEEAEDIQLEAR